MNQVDLIALDIAGTTLDEGGTVYRLLHESVLEAGGSASKDDVAAWMGADKRQAIRMLLQGSTSTAPPAADVDRVFGDFSARLAAAYRAAPPEPFPGVREALKLLRSHGIAIALTTGFDRSIAEPLIAAAGWAIGDVLDALVCSDEVAAGRPAPHLIHRAMERTGVIDVSRVLVAGDTVRDLEAGTNAGAGFVIGVLTGETDLATLGRARHTHLLSGVAEIPALLGIQP